MELRYTFDAGRYFLGKPCVHGHLFPGTECSLREAKMVPVSKSGYGPYLGSICVACQKGSFRGQAWHFRFIDVVASGLPAGSKLGKLCPSGHEFIGLGLSLRDAGGACPECRRERQRADAMDADTKARRRTTQNRYMHRKKKDPDFVLQERLRNKARKVKQKGNHSLPVSASEIRDRFNDFGGCCAFCGRQRALQIEHLLARAHGGPHVLGNLAPACAECNSSKLAKDLEAWYRAQPFFSEKRWRKILSVLGKRRGPVNQLPLL